MVVCIYATYIQVCCDHLVSNTAADAQSLKQAGYCFLVQRKNSITIHCPQYYVLGALNLLDPLLSSPNGNIIQLSFGKELISPSCA